MEIERKKVGRPRKPAVAGSRASLGLKVTAETKARIAQAADASGRTQSQEAEYRLERSFEQGGLLPDTLALGFGAEFAGHIILIAYTMQRAGRLAAWEATKDVACWQGNAWLRDATGYDAAAKAVAIVIEAARPPGKVKTQISDAVASECATSIYLAGGPDEPDAIYADDVRSLLGRDVVHRLKNYRPHGYFRDGDKP